MSLSWDTYDSHLNPKNWPFAKKLSATLLVTAISFSVQYASAADSMAAELIEAEFFVNSTVETLATGLPSYPISCVILFKGGIQTDNSNCRSIPRGPCLGSSCSRPLSEISGRNPVYLVSYASFMLLIIGTALIHNIAGQLILRFLAGVCGSASLVCAGGTVSDLWSPLEQIYIFPVYAIGGFMGLAIGPAVGGAIAGSSGVSWRWVEWSTSIMAGVILVLVLLLQPETYGPVLLQWKEQTMIECLQDHELGHSALLTEEDISRIMTTASMARVRTREHGAKVLNAFYRPVVLAVSEPVVIMISIYLSLLYVVVFTFLPGYTFIFTSTYDFSLRERGASFLGLGVGFLLTVLPVLYVYRIVRRQVEHDARIHPETLLCYAMIGAPAVPVSLFWMGWTARESMSPWSAIAASVLFGFGVLCVFFSSYQYIIHTHGQYAATGLVAVTLIRYLVAGGLILVGVPMYETLGVPITLTVLGSIAAALVPIPFYLYRKGSGAREK